MPVSRSAAEPAGLNLVATLGRVFCEVSAYGLARLLAGLIHQFKSRIPRTKIARASAVKTKPKHFPTIKNQVVGLRNLRNAPRAMINPAAASLSSSEHV